MSDSSASAVAIASMSLGNAQIVLFAIFVIFVMTFFWMTKSPLQFPFPIPHLPIIPGPLPIISFSKDEVISAPKFKDEVIPSPKDEVIPTSNRDLCQMIVNGNDENELPTQAEIKSFKKLLEYHGVTKSMQVLDAVDKRVYALIKRVEVLEAAETDRKNREVKELTDKIYQELVASEIKSIDTKIINGDGIAFDLILETKPQKEVIEHLRKRFSNMGIIGGLNDDGEVVCWTFKIPTITQTPTK